MSEAVIPYMGKRFSKVNNLELFLSLPKVNFGRGKKVGFVDVPELLQKFKKERFREINFSTYSLFFCVGKGISREDELERVFYGDTYYHFVLRNNNFYAAVLGVEFQNSREMIISQIQGVREMKDSLEPFYWTKAMVFVGLEFALRNKIERVMILPAERNKWWSHVQDANLIYLYYDVTAKKMGFKYDSKRLMYIKDII